MHLGFLCVVFTAVAPVTEQCLTHRRHSRNTHLLREPAVVSFIFSLSLFLLSVVFISVLTFVIYFLLLTLSLFLSFSSFLR